LLWRRASLRTAPRGIERRNSRRAQRFVRCRHCRGLPRAPRRAAAARSHLRTPPVVARTMPSWTPSCSRSPWEHSCSARFRRSLTAPNSSTPPNSSATNSTTRPMTMSPRRSTSRHPTTTSMNRRCSMCYCRRQADESRQPMRSTYPRRRRRRRSGQVRRWSTATSAVRSSSDAGDDCAWTGSYPSGKPRRQWANARLRARFVDVRPDGSLSAATARARRTTCATVARRLALAGPSRARRAGDRNRSGMTVGGRPNSTEQSRAASGARPVFRVGAEWGLRFRCRRESSAE
jgi:hypothetical protein